MMAFIGSSVGEKIKDTFNRVVGNFMSNKTEKETINNMEWQSIESSAINQVRFNKTTGTLEVNFNSGTTYRYFDVPEYIYNNMILADSAGQYFQKNIRNQYDTKRMS